MRKTGILRLRDYLSLHPFLNRARDKTKQLYHMDCGGDLYECEFKPYYFCAKCEGLVGPGKVSFEEELSISSSLLPSLSPLPPSPPSKLIICPRKTDSPKEANLPSLRVPWSVERLRKRKDPVVAEEKRRKNIREVLSRY